MKPSWSEEGWKSEFAKECVTPQVGHFHREGPTPKISKWVSEVSWTSPSGIQSNITMNSTFIFFTQKNSRLYTAIFTNSGHFSTFPFFDRISSRGSRAVPNKCRKWDLGLLILTFPPKSLPNAEFHWKFHTHFEPSSDQEGFLVECSNRC